MASRVRPRAPIAIGLALLAFVSAVHSTALVAQEPATRALEVRRPNLLVADLERSLRLYRDVLGMPLSGPIAESKATSYSYPVFAVPPAARMRFVYLTVGDKERGFGLTEVRGAPLPRTVGIHGSGLVLTVNDVDAVLKRVRALGLSVVEPRLNPPSPSGGALYEAAFTDFDGHLIVIYEMRRGAASAPPPAR